MTEDILADSIERLLADWSTPAAVRDIERDGSPAGFWQQIEQSGFADALTAEPHGGAGLSMNDVFPVFEACGRYAVPLPLAPTMFARAILASQQKDLPKGAITLALADPDATGDAVVCRRVPYARTADWVVVDRGGSSLLLPTNAAERTALRHGSLEADLSWAGHPSEAFAFQGEIDWRSIGASIFAAQLAGAMNRVFAVTLQYANERTQFGRNIGKFQAIQHQISVMAEHASAARMAARLGCSSTTNRPAPLLSAVAKCVTSEAAVTVASIGHAIHGAIGITAEFDLQLYTRRLYEWRVAFGSESLWHARVGDSLLSGAERSAVDFIRENIAFNEG
jgi:acyl-CoA dehydrogenase